INCCPIACAAASRSLRSASISGLLDFSDIAAIIVALGTIWCSSSSRFAANTLLRKLTPVTLPPGRLRLATRPSLAEDQPHRLPALVADLVRQQVALIVCNTRSAFAAKAATSTVPIVFVTGGDPVEPRAAIALRGRGI